MTYAPRPGSVAERAHLQLTVLGELSGAALADAIELDDAKQLAASLTVPLREGYISRVKRDGLWFYRVGDGVPVQPADEDVDDDPPVQRVVPAKAKAPLKATEKPKARDPKAVRSSPAPLQRESEESTTASDLGPHNNGKALAIADGGAVFGVLTDGRIVVEVADSFTVFSRRESDQLRRLLSATGEQV